MSGIFSVLLLGKPRTGGRYPPPYPWIKSSQMVNPASSISFPASMSDEHVDPCLIFLKISSNAASAVSCNLRKMGVGCVPNTKVLRTVQPPVFGPPFKLVSGDAFSAPSAVLPKVQEVDNSELNVV